MEKVADTLYGEANRPNASTSPGPLILWLRRKRVSESFITGLAGFSAFAGGGAGEYLEAWKSVPERDWLTWITSLLFTIGATALPAAIGLIREGLKRSDSEELAYIKATAAAQASQLESVINTAALIRGVIQYKQVRILGKPKVAARTLTAFGHRSQPEFILKTIYDKFRAKFTGRRLRIGLFGKSTSPFPHMEPLFSYDGSKTDCMTIDPELFRLDTDTLSKAEVAKCFLSGGDHAFVVIEDCHVAPSFCHFKTDEKHLLKSMLLFKHRMESLNSSIVLALDCDTPHFFEASMTEEYRHLLVEMMHRLEYELLVLQVVQQSLTYTREKRRKGTK